MVSNIFKIFLCWCVIQSFCIAKPITDEQIKKTIDNVMSFMFRNQISHKTYSNSEYKCANGESISEHLVCDQVQNCADGSDESWDICRAKYCLLPSYASNDISILNCDNYTQILNDSMVREFTVISIPSKVNKNNDLYFFCRSGKWYFTLSSPENEKERCKNITISSNVIGLYYKNGQQMKTHSDTHLPGTVIYPKCKKGTYPNVKEAVCKENGEWNVDYLECLPCDDTNDLKKLSFPLMKFNTSSFQDLGCKAHVISPYLVMTASTCFNISSSEGYFIQINRFRNNGNIDSSELIKIQKVYYDKSGQLALAELNHRLTFDVNFSHVCLDWKYMFEDYLEDFIDGGWSSATVFDEHHLTEMNIYAYAHSCENSTYFSRNYFSEHETCVSLNLRGIGKGNASLLTKKGIGFYISNTQNYYLKGIAIETSLKASSTMLFTNLIKYLKWIKSIIRITDRDHKTKPAFYGQYKNTYKIRDGAAHFGNFILYCSNKNMDVNFIDGCELPKKSIYHINYEVEYARNKFETYMEPINFLNAPENTKLQKVLCENGYTSPSQINSIECLRGSWSPDIPKCNEYTTPKPNEKYFDRDCEYFLGVCPY